MKMDGIRRRIDEIDLELLALLEERMELGLRVRRFKPGATDPRREQVVLDRAMRSSLSLVEAAFAERLFSDIITESKRLQDTSPRLVALQGEHGAYSEIAARALAPGCAYVPCREFASVFAGLEEGAYDLGVVPVENSLEGAISQVNDLLGRTDLSIVGEVRVPIHHHLVAPKGTLSQEVRVVYSHPQALGQCRGFLESRKLEARPFYDTAGAAQMVARERPQAAAAVASQLAAELYGLDILQVGIADDESNSTRFLLLSARAAPDGNKCSIVFVTPHQAGSLFAVLELFAGAGLNLTRIASMPCRWDPENYSFFLDFEGSDRDPAVLAVLSKVAENALDYRFLGCYPASREPGSGNAEGSPGGAA